MKISIISLLTIISISLSACSGNAQNKNGNQKEQQAVIQVIDFHSTHRCMTCNAIENQTKTVLEKHYRLEMEKGLITFQTVNVDDEENYNLAESFQVYGTALFINVVKNGKSTKINMTDFAFLTATNEDDSFEKGFKNEMDKAVDLL